MNTHEEYKTQLTAELQTITKELETIATYSEETGDWVAIPEGGTVGNADENVAADANEEWANRRALMPQLETRFRNIKRALDKIETGTFGICEISGNQIEPERLAANPAARTDISHIDKEDTLPI